MKSVTLAILGAGGRGQMFSDWLAAELGPGSVVAVAEPNEERRNRVGDLHEIPSDLRFETWQQLLDRPKLADALVNTTMDQEHLPSSLKGFDLGYHMLLEKPVATSLEDCRQIVEAGRRTERLVAVCHSLRHHLVYRHLRDLVRSGVIGDVVSLDQLEAVEHIHQSHSFVRGNWGNEARSGPMLLSKSCHDLDIIADLIGRPCVRVSSHGSLTYFRREAAPEGAPEFCVQGCPHESECPYSAIKVYADEASHWAWHAGLGGLGRRERLEKLRTSPFGRCVFQTDNDVVDHQVVAMEFEGGVTATFTMTAFTPFGGRYVRIHGTKGYLNADVDHRRIELHEFWGARTKSVIEVPEESGGHGGGDAGLARSFLRAIQFNDPLFIRTGLDESFASHKIVFAAERSRRERRTVSLAELDSPSLSELQPGDLSESPDPAALTNDAR